MNARPARRRPLPAAPAPMLLPLPTAWARERIAAAGGHLPDYGSPEWTALPDDDPRKLAAALVAAEVHRYEEQTLADRLARELAETRRTVAVAELHDAIERGARRAMSRDDRVADLAGKSIRSTVCQMTTAEFAESTPVRDSVGWPWVRQPGAAVAGEQLRLFAG